LQIRNILTWKRLFSIQMSIIKNRRSRLIVVVELKFLRNDTGAPLNTTLHQHFRQLEFRFLWILLQEVSFIIASSPLIEAVIILLSNKGWPKGLVSFFNF
jgi:hypothetical protein